MNIKLNQIVTRNSYNNDIIFQVIDIQDDIFILKGIDYRLFATAKEDDLSIYDKQISIALPHIPIKKNIASGKVLHVDGDKAYVIKAKEAYLKYGVIANCVHIDEIKQPGAITNLLLKDKYDILVLTGHDFLKTLNKQNIDDLTMYQNSYNFVSAVQQARRIYPDLDSLVIIAGACQSNYEALILNGANFASSPMRENIHLLDPIIVAVIVATTSIRTYVSPEEVVDKTISKAMGGIETKGKARIHFRGVNNNGYS
jgi:spore coat assembly protein